MSNVLILGGDILLRSDAEKIFYIDSDLQNCKIQRKNFDRSDNIFVCFSGDNKILDLLNINFFNSIRNNRQLDLSKFDLTGSSNTPFKGLPNFIIGFNQYTYVKNMISQLKKFTRNIHIVDNESTYEKMDQLYQSESVPIWLMTYNQRDQGPRNILKSNFFKILPTVFSLTDSDLQFDENLPENFLDILLHFSEKYLAYKVGMALELSKDPNEFFDSSRAYGHTLHVLEGKYWANQIEKDVYASHVDTTFSIYNKKFMEDDSLFGGFHLRIAGNFTAKHLPWYKKPILEIPQDEFEFYKNISKKWSTISNY